MTDFPRLIEHAFPLKQTSLDSVHEKNVRHGHISTLHIWPARRPLAACRAALIATLLPDPGTPEKRQELCEKIAGKVVKKIERKKMPNGQIVERIKEVTEGGILHWGRETENAETLAWFREEIRKAYGGRAPKVLDPFAGGGAIPLEAMRLGCEATAVDINPVAWFILKCTLEYPQKLAGQTRSLPEFILKNQEFMTAFFKAQGMNKKETTAALKKLKHDVRSERLLFDPLATEDTENTEKQEKNGSVASESSVAKLIQADLAWHVRAWGRWVLDRARRELAQYYPTYADFEPIKKDQVAYEHQPMRLVPLNDDGTADIDGLNAQFTEEYLEDKRNPRWVAKPTVAYLWARTVTCKNCRATVPLLKTLWLSRRANHRVLLTMRPNADRTEVEFGVETAVPVKGGNAAQRRENDKRISAGTMSRAGVKCPCCGAIMTMEDIRLEGQAGRLSASLTSVVIDGVKTKEYRPPTVSERESAVSAAATLDALYESIPYGMPTEPTPKGGGRGAGRAFSVQGYGIMRWCDLFTSRQLLTVGTFLRSTRDTFAAMSSDYIQEEWRSALFAALTIGVDRLADRQSMVCRWDNGYTKLQGTFTRFALPITWDFCEGNPLSDTTGNYLANLAWVAEVWEHAMRAGHASPTPRVIRQSAIQSAPDEYDCVVTDPPYYDAIPYSDLMDFFHIWLRRTLESLGEMDCRAAFSEPASPKWNHEANDGELIDDDSRHDGDATQSKKTYEDGMARVFSSCWRALRPEGRLVVVFAHKHPDAWETLVAAIIRAGFVVDGSWPIQTEMGNRTRALAGAALASSVWLVCKKRPTSAKPGWDSNVLDEMRENITVKLREFWDAGIRGPDFVWAATGPAMEAYSKHPVVRKANEPNATMGVGEFLNHVRRMVVDFVVGQVLTGEQGADMAAADRLDEVSAYYLLHRHDFGMDEAPVGACILYATACGLSDSELDRTWDILTSGGRTSSATVDEDDTDASEETGSGSKVKLKAWNQRRGKSMGYEAPEGKPVPLIDRIHRVMHLWKEGDVQKVDEYLDEHALRRNELFKRVVQSLIELSTNNERSLLESISNHIGALGPKKDDRQRNFPQMADAAESEGE